MIPFSHPAACPPQEIKWWRLALDRLSHRKMTWEQFLTGICASNHPALQMTTTRDGQSLLHLAVLSDRPDLAAKLITENPQLKLLRNHFGFTALELAQFLPRERLAALLQPSAVTDFCDQPDVLIVDRKRLQERLPLLYRSRPLFASDKVFREVLLRSRKAKAEDAIPPEKMWMGVYFDAEIHKGLHPKVSIRYIDEEIGFGVFAEQRISPCSLVGEYTGIISEKRAKDLEGKTYCVRYTIWAMETRKIVLDAETMGNFTRFINHSSSPNLGLQSVYWRGIPRMVLVSLKEIQAGEQLTFNYGMNFWKELKKTPREL
ncbi:MAG: SET domain-containing protein-lysine N-methyltransferase [Chlamydiia bacterium]|nr:SET domain-containing protein-lysine N-methyltransferase [Chlamydiia bacterium]